MKTTTQKASQEDSQEIVLQSLPDQTSSKSKSHTQERKILTFKKSASDLTPRLSRTLKRKPTFHELGESDLKYLYAAYKKGIFDEVFIKDLSPNEFKDTAIDYFSTAYTHAWMLGDSGVLFGTSVGPFVYLNTMKWFPWASDRQIVENLVGFLNKIRKTLYCVWDCNEKDKRFYEYIARHGIIRRVGTLHGLNHARLWETR